ncbi:MAG TPA: glutamate--tRNA ligase [Candidatus Nanoarchaeia archaeon]|nr:glutamate--tRNA ligase [Candidatus Nanoarchaeia archaeon]
MDNEIKGKILKYALQNAVKFNGKATQGAIIGKLFAESPELKGQAKDINREIAIILKEVNEMKPDLQHKKLEEIAPELLEKKHEKKEKNIFEFIGIKEGENVVTAFPPEPSKYPHIGHAKAIIMNYELAKYYNGKFVLRFEDTNPTLAKEEFYKIHLDNYEWLGIKPDVVDYVSDHIKMLYEYAEKFIKAGNAYICECPSELISEKRRKGEECDCRGNDSASSLKKWEEMFESKSGSFVLRLKGDMQSDNTTLRDPVIFRVIDEEHPRTGKKYRVWPNYDFENSIMDGLEGVTHRLRSKEFELRNELQRIIQKMAGFPETKIFEFARFNMEGVESSGRIIREKVQNNELIGWDDPSLTTLVALKRRGFLPNAIKNFVFSTGLSKAESVLTWDDLIVQNRRLLDSGCSRYFFVENPKEIFVKSAPKQEVELKLHPESKERGMRKFETHEKFYVSEKDFQEFNDGKLYRLMDCINFRKESGNFAFDSLDYEHYKDKGDKIIHWLPVESGLVNVEVLMPDKKISKGLAEKTVNGLKAGDIVQFARFGFCRLDEIENDKLKFWFTHD